MHTKVNNWGIFACYLPVDFKFAIKYNFSSFTQATR